MLKERITRFASRYGRWRLTHVTLAAGNIVLISIFFLQLVIPVQSDLDMVNAFSNTNVITANHLSEILQSKTINFRELATVLRAGLFKSATPSQDKPMAEKTIERIRSQLKLQCIMEMNGEPVAYINIKGAGLKKCKAGDTVNDLFTVLNINKKSVDVTIVGHRETLSL